MRWWVYAVIAYVVLGLQVSLVPVLEIGTTGIVPSLVLIYAAFLALYAPARAALWSCFILGLGVDLLSMPRLSGGEGAFILIGPNALGFTLAAYLLLQVRVIVVQRNTLTLAFCVFLAGLFVEVTVLAILSLRMWIEPFAWNLGEELGMRAGICLYSALAALPLSVLSRSLLALHDFPSLHPRWKIKR